jgi:hypothetical protein
VTHRLAFVGSCQVAGLRATAAALRPDVEVEAYHIGAQLSAEEIAERIVGFDTVITQIADTDPHTPNLSPSALKDKVGNVVLIPTFVFPGLHPDMIYIFNEGRPVPGAFSDMHSLIIATGYALGLSEERTQKLFNSYIFAELGYFVSYETSYQIMVEQFAAHGYDMKGMPEKWMQDSGGFMYTINHPAISVLSHMAVDSLKRAGLVEEGTAAPAGVRDNLFEAFVAPVFPPLARRIGIPENEVFLKPLGYQGDREVSLEEYIHRSFAIYRDLPKEVVLTDQVRSAAEKLDAILY